MRRKRPPKSSRGILGQACAVITSSQDVQRLWTLLCHARMSREAVTFETDVLNWVRLLCDAEAYLDFASGPVSPQDERL